MTISRFRRVCVVAAALALAACGSSTTSTTGSPPGVGTKQGTFVRVTITNSTSHHVWMTPYGSSTFDPTWHIVSDDLRCIGPGKSETIDMNFGGTNWANMAQVKVQNEITNPPLCSGDLISRLWAPKCTMTLLGDADLSYSIIEENGNYRLSPWKGSAGVECG